MVSEAHSSGNAGERPETSGLAEPIPASRLSYRKQEIFRERNVEVVAYVFDDGPIYVAVFDYVEFSALRAFRALKLPLKLGRPHS